MRYFIGISCEEYDYYQNINYCNNDLFLIHDTLLNYCDYYEDNCTYCMVCKGYMENDPEYWYGKIEEIIVEAVNDDTIIFYFAGHGIKEGEDAYLLLPSSEPNKEEKTAISLGKIRQIFNTAPCNCFSIIDACHSGFDVRGSVHEGFLDKLLDKSWATLASCSKNECSYPDKDKEQGIFTYYISESIKLWEKESKITFEELKVSVSQLMEIWCLSEHVQQHPTLNASVVGIQEFAIRNNKISQYEVIVHNEEGDEKMDNEIAIIETTMPTLWSAAEGILLPKKTEIAQILGLNAQLRERELEVIYKMYNNEAYEFASETMWERAIIILRSRVLSLGVEFVSEMVGLDNLEYVNQLPAYEVINLASELGFIDGTGKMRLSQANELVQHYKGRDVKEEMPQNESDTVIRACIQYVLGYEDSQISMEFGDFRSSLKFELFEIQPQRLEMIGNSPYFYKKTTIRTLINLLATTEGAEYERVSSNFVTIIKVVWEGLSSDDRYFIGLTYSKYANSGSYKYIQTFKQALEKVHGFDYVPENLRSFSFIQAAKNIKRVHNEFNNFYNEPEAVSKLECLGNQLPKPALKESISACLMVVLGNAYGTSITGEDAVYIIFDKIDNNYWEYYLNECLKYDGDVLEKIARGDRRTKQWSKVVDKYDLSALNIKEKKIKDLLVYSKKEDFFNTKSAAFKLLKGIK